MDEHLLQKNNKISNTWLQQNRNFFEENYAHLGFEREYNPKSKDLMLADSYNKYKFFASGRVYTNWTLVHIDLKRRQDLFINCSSLFLYTEKDHIYYQCSLAPADGTLPVVFMVCKTKDVKAKKKAYQELVEFTDELSLRNFNENNLSIYAENLEFIEKMFTNRIIEEEYNKIKQNIETIFFTDRKSISKAEHAIYFSYTIADNKNKNVYYDITLFTHMIIDYICSTSLKASYKKEAEVRRKEYDQKRSRELAEKNAEEVKNQKEEMKNNLKKPLTREQAYKLEEKERQDNLRRQKRKMFKIIKNQNDLGK